MITSLAFVMLGATDVDRSVAFYRDTLGLELSARFEDFALMNTGATTLALSGELARAGTGTRERCEVVFGVESVSAAYDALRAEIAFINEPHPINPGNWVVNFDDPDGHSLSFYGPQ